MVTYLITGMTNPGWMLALKLELGLGKLGDRSDTPPSLTCAFSLALTCLAEPGSGVPGRDEASLPPPQSQRAERAPASQARPGSLWQRGLQHSLQAVPAPSCRAARWGAVLVLRRSWGRKSWGPWRLCAGRCTPLGAKDAQGAGGGHATVRPGRLLPFPCLPVSCLGFPEHIQGRKQAGKG